MKTEDFIRKIRISTLQMIHRSKASHIGSCLSCIDILGVLYNDFLNFNNKNKNDINRDFFIMSKGHASAALYSTLALKGLIPLNYLEKYCCDDAKLAGHITYVPDTGVEISSGSLGHGLPIGLGISYSIKNDNKKNNCVVLLSDGECQEGSNWEAFLAAPRLEVNNLTVIIDYNKIQGYDYTDKLVNFSAFPGMLKSLGWQVHEIDGHSINEIKQALEAKTPSPKCVVAHTIKGKGVSFMENQLSWHYKSTNSDQLEMALMEISNNEK